MYFTTFSLSTEHVEISDKHYGNAEFFYYNKYFKMSLDSSLIG